MSPAANHRPYVLTIVVVPFLGTVLAMYLLWHRAAHLPDLVLLVTMYILAGFGVTVGFHRMSAHHSFRAHPAAKLVLLILGSMAVQAPPIEWAATHVKHHALSDREGDPHSPMDGFFHAHVGWLFKDRFGDPQRYSRHLLEDPIVVFVNCTYLLWVA